MKIRPVRAKLIHVDGQTDTTNLFEILQMSIKFYDQNFNNNNIY
jgi:hypothetical protein